MNKLTTRNRILVGLTLFSMFFGAGNLIFPPFLGALAGTNTWVAMAGFALTAVGIPVLGIIAIAESGGLKHLAGWVHPKFASIFILLVYLSIGPGLAIPRTASTSFEMAVKPFMEVGAVGQLVYSVVFFAVAFLVALNPDKLTQKLGKILTPCLLTLIFILFVGCLINPVGPYGAATGPYAADPLSRGFLEGYQTMDTLAALNFGLVIAMNIRAFGVQDEDAVVHETINAGLIAGGLLVAVYAALAHIGAMAGGNLGEMSNGADTLTLLANYLFGKAGMVLLGIIFVIACLNTCIGLISCCSNYFCTILPQPGYVGWAAIFAIVSMVVSNAGLNRILLISVPILNAIYPVAIVLIALALIQKFIGKYRYVYKTTIFLTALTSITAALSQSNIRIPVLAAAVEHMPLFELGLEWIFPAVVGLGIGCCLHNPKAD